MPRPQTYARALRVVAVVVAVAGVARALASGSHPPDVLRSLVLIRLATAAVALFVALLASPARDPLQIRRLAFLLGVDAWCGTIGVFLVTPAALWEQGAVLAALLLGSALFMPWSWRWQAALASLIVVGTTGVVLALGPASGLFPADVVRLFVTLAVFGAASALGAGLRDSERASAAAAQAERHEHDRRRVREQRLDALTRLAGGFAHQFNNLLGGILSHASLLREDSSQAAAQRELDEILAAARRGADLTKELLRFTRHAPVNPRATAVADVVRGVTELAHTILPETASVDVQAPADLPAIRADPDHLVQACMELVLNARDAAKPGEPLRLSITAGVETVSQTGSAWPDAAPGRYVRLSIADTGIGMDQATLERVFEPFFTTKPMHRAAGLGLAQVYQTVRDHGGAARIDSAPRRGTTVHLLIPVAAGHAETPPTLPPAAGPMPVTGLQATDAGEGAAGTILVVDDEPIVRNSLRRALTRFGYRVLEAGDGASALAAVQSADPPVDLVILDLVLPGGGAGIFEVLKAVRPDLKVLVSSGYTPDADSARALASRADGFLPKPYEMAELKRAVARAMGRAA
jgi:signal transduction histidine kinase/CheY-like chemotaxis protein